MNRYRPHQGFTLIEVLIAMTLLSIMVVLLFGSLKICAESWEKGEKKITEVNDVAAVINFFQRHLTVAKPLWNDFNKEEKVFSFQGGEQSLQFVSSFPASAGRAGLQLFSVELLNENREKSIKVTLMPFYPVAEGQEWLTEEEILIRRVKDFSLAYFGSDDEQTDPRWLNEWLQKDRQPALVKIKIDLENGRFWPEMVIDLKMAGSIDNAGLSVDGADTSEDDDSEDTSDPEEDE